MNAVLVSMNESDFDSTPPQIDASARPSASGPTPHPALDGKRIKMVGSGAIYFVWNGGYKCWVPDPTTYNNMFQSWDNIEELAADQFDAIATGAPITSGAMLAAGTGQGAVFLVTNGHKNFVTQPSVMTYCNFRWPSTTYPPVLIDFIPMGVTIDYGASK